MNNEDLYTLIHNIFASAVLGYCRIAPIFFLMPFLGSGNIPNVVRHPVIMIVAWALAPHYQIDFLSLPTLKLVMIIVNEASVGTLLAVILVFPFWVFHTIGDFIDNQRGATFSSTLAPAIGVDASELTLLFNLFSAVVYLSNGGMLLLLETIRQSYQLYDAMEGRTVSFFKVVTYLNTLMAQGIIYASPVIAIMLGIEIILGLLSRYASQLNAFSISLTVKSGVAFLILLTYFTSVLAEKVMVLVPVLGHLSQFFRK
ncbi:SpaR/YscT/HrcT type III secretion system export apparatus protein [Salmonella enterica]|nr:SpaR/YscT/HrcT type III secretion system export apparatus protein [Salmonella enterica]EHG4041476.1 SpaR/YscT/HrcT type III secretion system export apparatus protein [Salmonella enterica]EHG6848956.1 SpaR/YscT/HrcT type III secretion system export apparatus protein [Salmonella enterica]